MPSVTINRLDAVQRWPVEKNAPLTAQATAVSRSASSSTTSGFLPPISSCTLPWRPATVLSTVSPVSTEPVKVTPLTSRLSRIASPTVAPEPMTRLKAPAGSPARERISASAQAEPGTSEAGLKTTQLP